MTNASNLPTIYQPIADDPSHGPAMRAILPKQRAFVLALLDIGGQDNSKAAGLAGYGGTPGSTRVQAHRLAHDPAILEAIKEEANKRLHSGAILGASVLLEIAKDPLHKDRLKAANALLDRGGLMVATQHKVTVEHTAKDADVIQQIKAFAVELGIDPIKLLGSAGVVIDAEFTPVETAVETDEWSVGPED